jgi:hypothetical protein
MRFDLGWRRTLYSRYSWLLAESMLRRGFRFRFRFHLRLLGELLDVLVFLVRSRRCLVRESRTGPCPRERFWGKRGDVTRSSRGDCAALAGSAHRKTLKMTELIHAEGGKQVGSRRKSTHLRCRRHESACPRLTLSWLMQVGKEPDNKQIEKRKTRRARAKRVDARANVMQV